MRWLTEHRDVVLLGWLALVVVGSVLAIGGVPPTVLLIVGALSLALGSVAVATSKTRAQLAPVFILYGLALYSAVQALPLPVGWVRALSPAAADVWSRCLLPLGENVTTASLSLDPSASIAEAVKWASYAGLWFTASALASRAGCEKVLCVVFVAGAITAVASLGHLVLGADKVWGLYTPIYKIPRTHVGPLLNTNTLAGYMNLGVIIGLGLMFRERPLLPRSLLAVSILTMAAVSLRSASRGGLAALVVGLALFGVVSFVVARRREGRLTAARSMIALTLGIFALSVVVVLASADDYFWIEISSENKVKLQLPFWVRPMVSDHPWFGIGRGAFGSAFAAYGPPTTQHFLFTHPENFVVQWIAEWGVVVGGGALLAFTWLLRPTNMGFGRSSLTTAAWIGVFVLLAQNLAELGTELFAVGAAVAVTLGAAWGDTKRRGTSPRRKAEQKAFGYLRIPAFAALPLVVALPAVGMSTVDQDRRAISAKVMSVSKSGSREDRRAAYGDVRELSLRHPADYHFPMMGAVVARMVGDRPIPWLQRALERGPRIGRNHLLLAEVLVDYGLDDQALLELRLAAEYEPDLAFYATRVSLNVTRDYDRLLSSVPDGEAGISVLDALASHLASTDEIELRERIDREALRRSPQALAPRTRLVDRRVGALVARTQPCEEPVHCAQELEDHASAFEAHFPDTPRAAIVRANVALAEGRISDADEILVRGCKVRNDRGPCLQLHVEVLSKLEAPERFEETLAAFIGASCSSGERCANAHAWVADLHLQRKEPQRALESLRKAARQQPTAARWLLVADRAEALRSFAVVVEALTEVKALGNLDPGLEKRLEDAKNEAHRLTP